MLAESCANAVFQKKKGTQSAQTTRKLDFSTFNPYIAQPMRSGEQLNCSPQ
jgi:hypothetical protein